MYFKLIVCCFLLSIIYIPVLPQNPFMKKTNYNKYFAAKTPYRNVANMDTSKFIFKGCEPHKIWMMMRHGTRFPTMKYILGINSTLITIRDDIIKSAKNLSSDEILKLKNWKPQVKPEDEKNLHHEGEEEMIELAERMQMRFPELLPKIYSNTTYKFKYTATPRTRESAECFATGLFGRATSKHVWYPEPSHRDPVLRFYKLCSKWRKAVKKNPEALIERTKFANGTEANQTVKDLNKKYGISINFRKLHLMYINCAFEMAWSKYKMSPWCPLFTIDDLKVLEYYEDLKYYWIDGYGYELTYLQACPAIKDLVEFFQSKDKYSKAVLYFTHSGSLLKLIAHLGLYKDDTALLHNNYTLHENRLWRSGKIDAFGTNLAFILYKCEEGDKMLVLHQERPVRLPICPDHDLCDFNKFINAFNDSIHCDFDGMCNNTFPH